MEIKAVTKYDYKVYKDFSRFNLFHSKQSKRIVTLFIVMLILMFLLSLINVIAEGEITAILPNVCIAGFIILLWVVMYFAVPKLSYKFAGKLVNTNNVFTFKEDELYIVSENTQSSGTSTIKYEMLYMVYDVPEYYYIYLNMAQALLVRKDSVTKEEAEQIGNVLRKYLPAKKYVIRKK